ncbi:MAG: thiolase domain-containing protein [Chloroflexi bacterium]|nr:thiolase domain-containing protein [Chloroflexota bacterium]
MSVPRPVSIIGIGQVEVEKASERSLRELGAAAILKAMADAGVDRVEALFAGNMLGDELQGQKHIATLLADEAGLVGVEALQVRAATATGAAALRMAYLVVASGEADLAVAVGVEKMSEGVATPALAKALDAEKEVTRGATLISRNAELMRLYRERYRPPEDAFVKFSVNAHNNARHNPNALFRSLRVSDRTVLASRTIYPPLRLLDCAPICDGAAAVVLAPRDEARAYIDHPVHVLASSVATDRFRLEDRSDPLRLEAARLSAQEAFRRANVNLHDISLFEAHDAFSIMACLLLEAVGFARPGQGWRLAAENAIGVRGKIPISTMGGLKARGHPIGATALYQTCEIVLQLTGRAGKTQVRKPKVALLQSVGGAASTVITHVFGA